MSPLTHLSCCLSNSNPISSDMINHQELPDTPQITSKHQLNMTHELFSQHIAHYYVIVVTRSEAFVGGADRECGFICLRGDGRRSRNFMDFFFFFFYLGVWNVY